MSEGIGAKIQKILLETPIKFVVVGVLFLYAFYRNVGWSFGESEEKIPNTSGGVSGGAGGGLVSGRMDPESEAYINDRLWQMGSLTAFLVFLLIWLRHVNSKYETEEIAEKESERDKARREAGLTNVLGKEEFDDLDEKRTKNKTVKKESEIQTGKEKTE